MDQYRINQILRVAKLHYELGMSQLEIGKKEHLSKSTVSRLLKLASDMGMVRISIVEPSHTFTELEQDLMDLFPLKKVTILPDVVGSPEIILRDVCQSLANDLPHLVKDGSIIGIGWGKTTMALSRLLPAVKDKKLTVFQMNGSLSRILYDARAYQIIQNFSEHLNAQGYLFPAPAMVDTKEIAQAIQADSSYQQIRGLADQCDIAIYSLGIFDTQSIMYQLGYFSQEQYRQLAKASSVDICSHFIDIHGQIADLSQDARTLSVPLETIRNIPLKLVPVTGKEKAFPAYIAAKHGFIDYLYIDQPTARELRRLKKAES